MAAEHAQAPVTERTARRILHLIGRLGPKAHAATTRIVDRGPTRVLARSGIRTTEWQGAALAIDLRDNLQRTLYFTGAYEPTLLTGFLSAIGPDDIVLDVGANIGLYTLAAARHLENLGGSGRVIAVEPGDDAQARLRSHIEDAALTERVTIAPVAFGAETGVAELRSNTTFGDGDLGTASLLGDGELLGRCEVVPGAQWLADHGVERVDVVKVDVEGAEATALDGLRPILERSVPRLVQVEVLSPAVDDDRRRIFEILESVGLGGRWRSARGDRIAAVDDGHAGNVVFTSP